MSKPPRGVVLYRYVQRHQVQPILAGGFWDEEWTIGRDAQGKPFTMSGVGLSDRPEYQFAGPERVLLRVTLTVGEDAITDFEIIEEGNSYREWCIPAEIVNLGTVEILPADQV